MSHFQKQNPFFIECYHEWRNKINEDNYTNEEIVEKAKVGCKEQAIEKYNTKAAGTRYYVTYGKTHSNRYSADCKVEPYTGK